MTAIKRIAEFSQRAGLPLTIGTRDENLQPCVSKAFGIKVIESSSQLRVIAPHFFINKHLPNLRSNGRVAFTFGDPETNECYQLKGKFIAVEEVNEEDMQITGKNFMGLVETFSKHYGEHLRPILTGLNFGPMCAMTFQAEEIYDQTPGPGAGKKIN
jgi:hypothetical protein